MTTEMEKVCDKVRLLNVSCHFPAILQALFVKKKQKKTKNIYLIKSKKKKKEKVNISSYNIDTCCL